MKKIILQIFFAILILLQNLYSQDVKQKEFNFTKWAKSYPSHLIKGFEHSFFIENQPLNFFATSALIITLSRYDIDLSRKFKENPFMSEKISRMADDYGKTFGYGYFAGLGFITLESLISKNSFEKYFVKMEIVLESIAVTQLITQTLKLTTQRERPNKSDKHSFPSGHSSSTFALATGLNEIYGLKVGLPAYVFATIVGLQRINSNAHYLSDVLGGAIIGIFVGRGFASLHNELDKEKHTLTIYPQYNKKNASYNFHIQLNF